MAMLFPDQLDPQQRDAFVTFLKAIPGDIKQLAVECGGTEEKVKAVCQELLERVQPNGDRQPSDIMSEWKSNLNAVRHIVTREGE